MAKKLLIFKVHTGRLPIPKAYERIRQMNHHFIQPALDNLNDPEGPEHVGLIVQANTDYPDGLVEVLTIEDADYIETAVVVPIDKYEKIKELIK